MNSNRILIGLVVLSTLVYLLIYQSLERIDVPDVQWEVDYFYDNKEPHGGWLLQKTLEEVYTEERIKKLEIQNFIPRHDPDSRKGYFVIGNYLGFNQPKVDSLAAFVQRGNDAILVASDKGYYIDSLFKPYFTTFNFNDSIISLSLTDDNSQYELSYYYLQFDSATTTYFDGFDSLNIDNKQIEIRSYAKDTIPVFLHVPYGSGNFYIHSIPDAFSNIGMKQESMSDYAIQSLPFLSVDTLFLDHSKYNVFYGTDKSPLQFILSQPPLKWSYYCIVAGLLIFVISRGKRKQKVIPILPKNENTSLEYVHTLSELYRSQNQHHKLVTQFKTIFTQWVKKKYYLSPEMPDYLDKLSNKSKVPIEEIERLLNRLNSAIDNKRFGIDRLNALYKDLDEFYKKCN